MKAFIFVAVASILIYTIEAVEPNQVNLALDTVLHFHNKDRKADLGVIDKIQDFFSQIKNAMRKNARRSGKYSITFTDFILEAAMLLRNCTDTELADAYAVINEESKKYVNKDDHLRELFSDHDMRKYVSDKLDNVKDLTADDLRRHLDSVITVIKYHKETGDENDLLEVGDALFNGSSRRLKTALKNLEKLRRTDEFNLENVLRSTLKSVIFDHYLDLSNKVKGNLINMVNHYWRAFSSKSDEVANTAKKIKIKDVTPFRHEKVAKHGHKEKVGKHGHKNRVRSHTKKIKTSESISIEKDTGNSSGKQEIFLTDNELHKLINSSVRDAQKPKGNKNKSDKHFGIKNKQPSHKREHNILHETDNDKEKKNVRTSHRGDVEDTRSDNDTGSETDTGSEKDTGSEGNNEPRVLMGGQIMRDVDFRARSSKYTSTDEDTDRSSTEEIVIQHSNVIDVGMSGPGKPRINITFVSSEAHQVYDKSKHSRKSNVNDTLETAFDPVKSDDVNHLIKHIEEQIEDVKEQVQYVKSLAQSKRQEATPSNTTEEISSAKAGTNSGFSFRASYDPEFSYSSEARDSKHDSNNITLTNHSNSDTTIANESNESKTKKDVENTNNVTEPSHANDTHDVNKKIHLNNTDILKRETHEDNENIIIDINTNSTATRSGEASKEPSPQTRE